VQRLRLPRFERVEADQQPRRFEQRRLAHLRRVIRRVRRRPDHRRMSSIAAQFDVVGRAPAADCSSASVATLGPWSAAI
jgi:hypothetical protein